MIVSPFPVKPGGCEEAALDLPFYAPCNRPATAIVGWKGREDTPIPMCEACADHNVRNRGGEIVRRLTTKERKKA